MTLRASLAYFAIRAVNGVVALLSISMLTRLLSADEYGRYSLALSAATATASICFQWLNVATSRFYASVTNAAAVVSMALRSWMAISAAIACVAILFALLASEVFGQAMPLIVALGASAFGAYNLNLQIANAQGSPRRYARLSNMRSIGALLATGTVVLAGGADRAALLASFLITLAAGMGSRQLLIASRTSPRSDLLRDMMAYGLPQAATYVSIMAVDFADRFMIGSWHGPAAVAPYAATYDLTQQTVGVLLNVLYLASFPTLVRAWEQSRPEVVSHSATRLLLAAFFAATLICIAFVSMAPTLCRFMFGPTLAPEAARIMPPVAVAIALGGLKAYCFDIPMQLQKRSKLLVAISAGMAVVSIVANLILIPQFGAVGAAWAAACAFGLGALASFAAGRKSLIFDVNVPGLALRCMVACALAIMLAHEFGVALIASDWALPLQLGASALTSVAAGALALIAFAPSEIRLLLRREEPI